MYITNGKKQKARPKGVNLKVKGKPTLAASQSEHEADGRSFERER